jgi:hypothetical protein
MSADFFNSTKASSAFPQAIQHSAAKSRSDVSCGLRNKITHKRNVFEMFTLAAGLLALEGELDRH